MVGLPFVDVVDSAMDRRRFIRTVGGALLPASLVAHAQQPGKMPRTGVLQGVQNENLTVLSHALPAA